MSGVRFSKIGDLRLGSFTVRGNLPDCSEAGMRFFEEAVHTLPDIVHSVKRDGDKTEIIVNDPSGVAGIPRLIVSMREICSGGQSSYRSTFLPSRGDETTLTIGVGSLCIRNLRNSVLVALDYAPQISRSRPVVVCRFPCILLRTLLVAFRLSVKTWCQQSIPKSLPNRD